MFKMSKIILSFLLFSGVLFGQDGETEEKKEPEYGWNNNIVFNFNFTQNSFDNWSQGGESSWAWQTDLKAKFINDQANYNWANSGKLSYGKAKVGDLDARKAADKRADDDISHEQLHAPQ